MSSHRSMTGLRCSIRLTMLRFLPLRTKMTLCSRHRGWWNCRGLWSQVSLTRLLVWWAGMLRETQSFTGTHKKERVVERETGTAVLKVVRKSLTRPKQLALLSATIRPDHSRLKRRLTAQGTTRRSTRTSDLSRWLIKAGTAFSSQFRWSRATNSTYRATGA